MYNKLQKKIVFILIIVLVITVGINFLLSRYLFQKHYLEAKKNELHAIAQGLNLQLVRLLELEIPLNELIGFEELCEEVVSRYNDITYVSIMDTKGTILFHNNPDLQGTRMKNPELIKASRDLESKMVSYTENNNLFYSYILPVIDHKQRHVGTIQLGLPVNTISGRIYLITGEIAGLSLLIFFIATVLISLILSHWVTKPLIKLDNAALEIAAHGPEAFKEIDINSRDEIGRLASSFTRMTDQLNKSMVSRAYVENIISSMSDTLLVIDTSYTIQKVNEATCSLLNYSAEELTGQPVDIIFYNPDDNPFQGRMLPKIVKENQIKNYEVTYRTKGGEKVPVLLSCSAMKTEDNSLKYIVCTAKDISELKKADERLKIQALKMEHLAKHDLLTGLPNRYYFEEQTRELINNIGITHQEHALLFLDLDKFKVINDTCGHLAGDQLLREVSSLFKEVIRETDVVARIGGDEFGIILKDISISLACEIAERIYKTVKEYRFIWEERVFSIGVSIGLTKIDSTHKRFEDLLSTADKCCYIAKEKGGNRYYLFSEDDQDLSQHNVEVKWLPTITQAIQENQFQLYYQPIVAASTELPFSWYEILLRMLDSNGRLIMPGSFLPAAERYNMMPTIDRWVISHFFSIYNKHFSGKSQKILFNLNISGASINDETFRSFIKTELEKYNVPADRVCFELTESIAFSNLYKTNHFIQQLRELGCRFALDDFGSGFSSFEYLKYLPVDYIKIDGSFIKNIASSQLDTSLVSAINQIAQTLNLLSIAEYVESEEIYYKLKEIGIDYAQGYWVGKPQPLQKLYNSLS